jgi:hypothetical protein
MYIRRKVFSSYLDESGEERLFSSTEFVDEDQYLDEMMYSDYSDEELEQKEYASIRSQAKAASRMKDVVRKIRRNVDKYDGEKVVNKFTGILGRSGRVGKGVYNTTNPKLQKALGRFARSSRKLTGQPANEEAVKRAVDFANFNSKTQIASGGKGHPIREMLGI